MQQSQNSSTDHQTWIKFFRNALIPSQYASEYAKKFNDNRIRLDMLSDLNRELLQEMGITALGDCLSILKHAKTINDALEEASKKELQNSSSHSFDDSPHSNIMKKRCELAKRLIGNFTNETEVQKTINEPTKPANRTSLSTTSTQNGSSLSADLQSRLTFNSSSNSSTAVQPVVKFNEGSLLSKVVVSSTTIDDDDNDVNLLRVDTSSKNLNSKRKLSGRDDEDDDDQYNSTKNSLKKRASTSSITITTNASPKIQPSVKSRLSLNLNSNSATRTIEPKIVRLNKTIVNETIINRKIPTDGLYSSREEEKTSVFDRIKKSDSPSSSPLASRLGQVTTKSLVGETNKATIMKSLGGTGKRVETTVTKSRVVPVSVTLSNRLSSGTANSKPSLKDRLSYN